MKSVQYHLYLFLLVILFEFHECKRPTGGSRPRPRPTHYPITSHPSRTTSRYHSSRYTTPRSQTTPRGTTGVTLPPRPGSSGFNPQGPSHVKYNIKNNYISYPGQYHLPVQSPHPGYFYAPSYHYSSNDVGSTALGLYLGYSLAKLTTPTYSHYTFYDGYRPKYDHYTVHHYYHDKDSVPKNQEIQSNTIVGCVGDSGSVCPANTTSLCTTNGALMCVVSATSTVPCSDIRQVNCIKSTISCVNNTAPECKNSNSTTISIPCISNARINGEVKYDNNTILATAVSMNNETSNVTSTTSSPEYSTKYPITTTPEPKMQEAPKDFCVTVIALPAEKPPTEGEKIFDSAKEILSNFIETAWGLS